MAYVLSEALQRKKMLSHRSVWGIHDFLINCQHEVPRGALTSNGDFTLQEMMTALNTADDMPCMELSSRSKASPKESKAARKSEMFPDASTQESPAEKHNDYFSYLKESKEVLDVDQHDNEDRKPVSSDAKNVFNLDNPDCISDSTKTDHTVIQGTSGCYPLPETFKDDLNVILDLMTDSHGRSLEHSLTPIGHSTPISSSALKSNGSPRLDEMEWIAVLFNEFRCRLLDIQDEECMKCDFEDSRIDKNLVSLVKKIFYERTYFSQHRKNKSVSPYGVCYLLNEMRPIGLDIERHLTIWYKAWLSRHKTVLAFDSALVETPYKELLNTLLEVSFEFSELHKVLMNCLLFLYRYRTTYSRQNSVTITDLERASIHTSPSNLLHLKTDEEYKRLQVQLSSAKKDSSDDNINCNLDVAKRSEENISMKKNDFFDELEWQAILFEELKSRICNELGLLLLGNDKSLYSEEDPELTISSDLFVQVVREVFPDVANTAENLSAFGKIFCGLARFTQFDFSRHLLQWHSVYKSQSKALTRYEREDVSYVWLIGELNFLNFLESHPLRIMIDCLLMLTMDDGNLCRTKTKI